MNLDEGQSGVVRAKILIMALVSFVGTEDFNRYLITVVKMINRAFRDCASAIKAINIVFVVAALCDNIVMFSFLDSNLEHCYIIVFHIG